MKVETLAQRVSALTGELTEIYKDLHRHPELGFEEFYTAEKVAVLLKKWGYEVATGIGGTGVIGVLRGSEDGPTIALRACLDALAISEQTGVDYRSENPGNMHACGHDGNMTVTLGAAKVLAGYRDVLRGNVKIIFQPSEENTGGAAEIIRAGGLKKPDVDVIITPHIWHDLPCGKICLKEGPVLASSDLFKLEVHGTAGHGAWPQLCVDPLPIAAQIILSLQSVISREVDPVIPACLTIGKVNYGTAANIISKTVTLYGTVRTYNAEIRDFIQNRIEEISYGITKSGRGSYTLEYQRIMPPLVNDSGFTALAAKAIGDNMGNDAFTSTCPQNLGCEEFSVYLDSVPGLFMFIGSSKAESPAIEIHSPKFLFPQECLPIGVRALCEIALEYFKTKRP